MDRRNFVKTIGAGTATVAGMSVFGKEKEEIGFWSPLGQPQNWQIPTYVDETQMFGDEEVQVRVITMTDKFWPTFFDKEKDHEIFCPIYPKSIADRKDFLRLVKHHELDQKIHIVKCEDYPDLEGMFCNPRLTVPRRPDTTGWTSIYEENGIGFRWKTSEEYWAHVYDQGVSRGQI